VTTELECSRETLKPIYQIVWNHTHKANAILKPIAVKSQMFCHVHFSLTV